MSATLAGYFEQVALFAAAAVGVVAVATWLLVRRRRDVWYELAKRRGLRFVDRSGEPRITGQAQGRSVEVMVEKDAGSDLDVGGVEVVQMSVGLHGVPNDMTAEGVPGLIGDLAGLTEDRIEFEAEDFNREVLVKGTEAKVRSYWSGRRQDVFLELIRSAPCDQVVIREGKLTAELREIVSDRHRLEQLLDKLLTAATVLDASTGQGAV